MDQNNKTQENLSARLDKWLWAARFYKTRAIAKQMIDGGKVFYNGQRSKSSKAVNVGDLIRIRQGHEDKEVLVIAIAERRKDATFAQTLYQRNGYQYRSERKKQLSTPARYFT